ncbi:MAG: geranylgeranylglyceryl/heptaprenylglyceryl phosphate synthase [Candidatus Aenigmatarchaeota archaeon]
MELQKECSTKKSKRVKKYAGSVEKYIKKKLNKNFLHFSLIDPDPSKTRIEYVKDVIKKLEEAGTDAIMIGGSTGVKNSFLDEVAISIKESCSLPVILFPGNPETGISKYADAIFFLCLMNAKDIRFATGYQSIGARIVKSYGIEPIPVGYIIIEPGMTVGKNAELIRRDDIDKAIGYALAAQYMGMRLVYLEAGSGAYEPVPLEMIKAVKHEIDIPLIVGGGIKTEEQAKNAIIAGADIIVTGTIIEKDIKKSIEIVKAIKSLKRRKLKNKR